MNFTYANYLHKPSRAVELTSACLVAKESRLVQLTGFN